jgi:acyl carrier protein
MTDTATGSTQVRAVVAAMAPNPTATADLAEDTRLVADLAYDSVRLIELSIALERYFGLAVVADELLAAVTTVGDVIDLVAEQLGEAR